MLPAGTITRIQHDEQTIFIDRSKELIKDAPEYDPHRNDREYHTALGGYYGTRHTV